MKPTSAVAVFFLAGLFLTACQEEPTPEVAYIDLSAVQGQDPMLIPPPPSPPVAGAASPSVSIPGLPSSTAFTGRNEAFVEEAVALEERNLQRLREEYERSLIRAIRSELAAMQVERRAELEQALSEARTQAMANIRGLFLNIAPRAGLARWRAALVTGSPTPAEAAARTMDPIAGTDPLVEEDLLYEIIEDLEQEFQQDRRSTMETFRELERTLSTELLAEFAEIELERVAEARRQASELEGAEASGLEPSAFDPRLTVPESESVQLELSASEPDIPWLRPEPAEQVGRRDRLREEAQIFAESRGMIFTEDPGAGANMTKEFLEWRERMVPGG
jgi:hypothetical protein